MRKFCCVMVVSIILLMVSFSFAQSPRQPTSSEGKTTFTNISAVGIDKNGDNATTNPGVPGYIEMVNSAGNTYYLYIDYNGLLCIASAQAVGYQASPAVVGWGTKSTSGVAVGSQY